MQPKIFLILFLFLVFAAGLFVFLKNKQPEKKIHFHAGFTVYVDGKKQDFSDTRYMDVEPCTLTSGQEVHEDEQIEKAHLHDNVGDVVHVHREGAVWADLFKNIRYTLPQGKPVHGYVNGIAVSDILSSSINPYDSIIIVVGDNQGIDMSKTVTKEHIQEVEKKSETCGS